MSRFAAECTPGYYNGDGTTSATGMTFNPGPVVFHRLLREWRDGDMSDVLVNTDLVVPQMWSEGSAEVGVVGTAA